jgi:hypothetical protein
MSTYTSIIACAAQSGLGTGNGEHWAVYGATYGKIQFLKLLYGDLSPTLGGASSEPASSGRHLIAEWKRQVGYVSPELVNCVAAANVTDWINARPVRQHQPWLKRLQPIVARLRNGLNFSASCRSPSAARGSCRTGRRVWRSLPV